MVQPGKEWICFYRNLFLLGVLLFQPCLRMKDSWVHQGVHSKLVGVGGLAVQYQELARAFSGINPGFQSQTGQSAQPLMCRSGWRQVTLRQCKCLAHSKSNISLPCPDVLEAVGRSLAGSPFISQMPARPGRCGSTTEISRCEKQTQSAVVSHLSTYLFDG